MSQTERTPGRNEPCHCGSGRKYKQCCLMKDEAKLRKEQAKAAARARKAAGKKKPEPEEAEEKEAPSSTGRAAPGRPPRPATNQPWKKPGGGSHPSQRRTMPRKSGGK